MEEHTHIRKLTVKVDILKKLSMYISIYMVPRIVFKHRGGMHEETAKTDGSGESGAKCVLSRRTVWDTCPILRSGFRFFFLHRDFEQQYDVPVQLKEERMTPNAYPLHRISCTKITAPESSQLFHTEAVFRQGWYGTNSTENPC